MYERREFYTDVAAGADYPVPLPLPKARATVSPSPRALAAQNAWVERMRPPADAQEWEEIKAGTRRWLDALIALRPPRPGHISPAQWDTTVDAAYDRWRRTTRSIDLDEE